MSHTKIIHSRETMVSKGIPATGFKFHDRIKRRLPFKSSCPNPECLAESAGAPGSRCQVCGDKTVEMGK
jgi:rRNA maturation endonuclease Nob1